MSLFTECLRVWQAGEAKWEAERVQREQHHPDVVVDNVERGHRIRDIVWRAALEERDQLVGELAGRQQRVWRRRVRRAFIQPELLQLLALGIHLFSFSSLLSTSLSCRIIQDLPTKSNLDFEG